MPPLRASGALHSNLTAPVRLLFRRSLCARDPDQTTRGDAPRGPQSPSNPAGCDGTPTQSMLFQSPFSVHKRGGGERHQAPSAFSTARSKSNGTLKVCSCCGRRPRRFDPRSLEPPPPPSRVTTSVGRPGMYRGAPLIPSNSAGLAPSTGRDQPRGLSPPVGTDHPTFATCMRPISSTT